MVSYITIILFFVYLWGLGFTATYFLKKPGNSLEKFFLNLGVGLGIFPILSILINFLRIPLDWKLFLVLSLLFPLYILFKNLKDGKLKFSPQFKLTKSTIIVFLVILIALFSLYMYTKGAFGYPYLENEDPWGHAVGVKYVALEKTAYDPDVNRPGWDIDAKLSYMDPYPPAYDVLMGMLHQTSVDLKWTIKFFNSLIISLGIIFFFLFAKAFMNNGNKALFATFILATIPCFLSHFIWAHSLVIIIFFPCLYAFERIKTNSKWAIIAGLIVASIWVTQNVSQPVKLTTMLLIYLIVSSVIFGRILKWEFIALIGGGILSFFWWGAMLNKYGLADFLIYYTGEDLTKTTVSTVASDVVSSSVGSSILSNLTRFFYFLTKAGGSGARAYSFDDFFYASKDNMINNPIGIGVVISLLALLGIIYILIKYKSKVVAKENVWLCISLFWLIFAFWGVNGLTFPVSVARGSFRVWMLLAIPVSLIATEGFYFLKLIFRRYKLVKFLVVVGIIMGVIFTSGIQKYEFNTATWPTSGTFMNPQEAFHYGTWFDTLPRNTKVLLYSPRDKITIGFGAFSCDWCQEEIDFREKALYLTVDEIYSFLIQREYKYFVVNPPMDYKYFSSKFGKNETEKWLPERYKEISGFNELTPIHQIENGFVVFEVIK